MPERNRIAAEETVGKDTAVKKVLILTLGLGGEPGKVPGKKEPKKTEEEQRQILTNNSDRATISDTNYTDCRKASIIWSNWTMKRIEMGK